VAASRRKVSGSARATIDHDEIREWVEEHGGQPAMVRRTRGGRGSGILRIDFPGYSGENSLDTISWDDFFARFEEARLAFLYQDATGGGRPSRFNKLVARDTVEAGSDGSTPRAAKKGARSRAAARSTEDEDSPPESGRRARRTQKRSARGTTRQRSAAAGTSARKKTARKKTARRKTAGAASAGKKTTRKSSGRATSARQSGAAGGRKVRGRAKR